LLNFRDRTPNALTVGISDNNPIRFAKMTAIRKTADVTGVSAINPLVAFYDIQRKKGKGSFVWSWTSHEIEGKIHPYIHATLYPRFLTEVSQIFLQDTFYQNYLAMMNTADVTDLSAISPIVAFYDIHGRKKRGAIRLFCPGYHMRL
jgi:hypothetical protein